MNFKKEIIEYTPINDQEKQDKKVLLWYLERFHHNILCRDNEIAHITSSGFILNKSLDKALMIHHNIRNQWAWTGGHADGDEELLNVAIKEAKEETGIEKVYPLTKKIASIDILPVYGHIRKNEYVNAHLHLSIAYILLASEDEKLIINEDENSGVNWIDIKKINEKYFDTYDVYIYNKLIRKAKEIGVIKDYLDI